MSFIVITEPEHERTAFSLQDKANRGKSKADLLAEAKVFASAYAGGTGHTARVFDVEETPHEGHDRKWTPVFEANNHAQKIEQARQELPVEAPKLVPPVKEISKFEMEESIAWRKGEFCISFPPRYRYPTGTLHRSVCPFLSIETRVASYEPCHVYPQTLERFRETANQRGVGGYFKICQRCCADITVVGQNMAPLPEKKARPAKTYRVETDLTQEESMLLAELASSKGYKEEYSQLFTKLLAAVR